MPTHLLYRQHVATAAIRASSPTRQAMASRHTWTQLTPAVEATTAQRFKDEKRRCFEIFRSYTLLFFWENVQMPHLDVHHVVLV